MIIGDVAATLADLAIRKLLRVEPDTGDGGWLVSQLAESAPRHRLDSLLGYEEILLAGLSGPGGACRLSSLATQLPPTLDKTRAALIRDAVHRGWLRHLHHDGRTEQGQQLAARTARSSASCGT